MSISWLVSLVKQLQFVQPALHFNAAMQIAAVAVHILLKIGCVDHQLHQAPLGLGNTDCSECGGAT